MPAVPLLGIKPVGKLAPAAHPLRARARVKLVTWRSVFGIGRLPFWWACMVPDEDAGTAVP
jgi:hypothetical protein